MNVTNVVVEVEEYGEWVSLPGAELEEGQVFQLLDHETIRFYEVQEDASFDGRNWIVEVEEIS